MSHIEQRSASDRPHRPDLLEMLIEVGTWAVSIGLIAAVAAAIIG